MVPTKGSKGRYSLLSKQYSVKNKLECSCYTHGCWGWCRIPKKAYNKLST